MRSSDNICALAQELGINRDLLYRWRGQLEATPAMETASRESAAEDPRDARLREENELLKRALAEKSLEVDFFRGALQKSRLVAGRTKNLARGHLEPDPGSDADARPTEYRTDVLHGAGQPAGFYRSMVEKTPAEEELEVRAAIQKIALEHGRRYGYRRITAELRRQGMQVNRKRVARIMREDNLLAIQPRSFVVTTESRHELEVYLNLAGRMKLTGINQLWVADVTYIRLQREFVYLAVILDASPAGWRMGTGLHFGRKLGGRGAGESRSRAATHAGSRASFRSRRAVCVKRLCGDSAETPNAPEHEPSGESV